MLSQLYGRSLSSSFWCCVGLHFIRLGCSCIIVHTLYYSSKIYCTVLIHLVVSFFSLLSNGSASPGPSVDEENLLKRQKLETVIIVVDQFMSQQSASIMLKISETIIDTCHLPSCKIPHTGCSWFGLHWNKFVVDHLLTLIVTVATSQAFHLLMAHAV